MIRLISVLTIICIISALILGLTNKITKPRIDKYKKLKIQLAKKSVLPDAVSFQPEFETKNFKYYRGLKDTATVGYVCEATIQGFSGDVKIMVGFNTDLTITGLKSLDHKETPGLGARIDQVKPSITEKYKDLNPDVNLDDPWFCEQFKGKKLKDINLKKDNGKIDGITAATITSRAVTHGVRDTIIKFKEHQQVNASSATFCPK